MFKNLEGNRVPDVTFRTRRDHEWVDLTSKEIFDGKSVIVFSLPGAFTPTCSSSHVPRYNQLVPKFEALGVDEVICVSVNDAFVMNEWQRAQNADRVSFLPDGNGEFTEGMGLLVGKEDLGFGRRSWRYSMLVRDGVIEKMFIEPQEPGDPFHVSDADTMLEYLEPGAQLPYDVAVFSREGCPFCVRTKGMLNGQPSRENTARAVRSACAPRACCATPASSSRSSCSIVTTRTARSGLSPATPLTRRYLSMAS